MSGYLIGPIGVLPAVTGGVVSLIITDNTHGKPINPAGNGPTQTFTNVTFNAGTWIVYLAGNMNSGAIVVSGVTANGNAMTQAAQAANGASGIYTAIYYLPGQSANAGCNVVVTATGANMTWLGMIAGTLTGDTGISSSPVTGTAIGFGNPTSPLGTLTVPTGGIGLISCGGLDAGSAYTYGGSGTVGYVGDANNTDASGTGFGIAAGHITATDSTINMNSSGPNFSYSFSAAAFSP